MLQLDLFENDQVSLLIREFQRVQESSEKVRRCIFAELADVKMKLKEYRDVQNSKG